MDVTLPTYAMPEREFKILITGDSAPLANASKEGAGSLKRVENAQEEAGKAAEKHGGHLHALHKIFHALNEVVPGLGIAMQAAFSPIGAAISLAVLALRSFHEKMKEVNEEFQKMEDEAAAPLTRRTVAFRDAVVEARTELEALSDRLNWAARAEQTLKQQTDLAIAASHQRAVEAATLAEALKDHELAQMEMLHTSGLVGEEKYAQEKLLIEAQYLKKKRELQEQEEMTSILIRRRLSEQAELNQPKLTTAAEMAEQKKISALEDLGSLRSKAELESDKQKAEEALKKWDEKHGEALAAARSAVQRDEKLGYGKPGATSEEIYGLSLDRSRLSPLEDQREKLQAAADLARRQYEQAPGVEARKKAAADRASREAERAAKRAEDNEAFITDTNRDVETRRAEFDERHKANAKADALTLETGKLGMLAGTNTGATAIGDMQAAVETAKALNDHKNVSDESKTQLIQIASAVAGHQVSLATAVKMMEAASHNMGIFVQDVVRLADVMVLMMSSHTTLDSKLNFLESQIQTLQSQNRNALLKLPGSG